MTNAYFEGKCLRSVLLAGALAFALTAPASAQWPVVQEIDNAQLQSLIEKGVPIVDLRTPGEWGATGIISGSVLPTFFDARGNYDIRNWLNSFVDTANQQDEAIIICAAGNRSYAVIRFLAEQLGFQKLYNVSKGIDYWIEAGYPVRKWP